MFESSLLFLAFIVLSQGISYPIAFTVVRNINQPLNIQSFLNATGCCIYNSSNNASIGYNLVSLDGFSSTSSISSIQSGSTPLSLWNNAFQAIAASKTINSCSNTAEIQNLILTKYHEADSKLLFNALSNSAPISMDQVPATNIAANIANVLSATQLDGVSIEFSDYHAVASGSASLWLQTLLSNLRNLVGNKIIVLIIPSTFPARLPFLQQPLCNSYVDYFVLKYYDTNAADYASYQTLFEKSNTFLGTSFTQLLTSQKIAMDMCRTLIAKQTGSNSINSNGYVDSNTLASAFIQAYQNIGWFGGFANLDFEGDSSTKFEQTVLDQIRLNCYLNMNCQCV